MDQFDLNQYNPDGQNPLEMPEAMWLPNDFTQFMMQPPFDIQNFKREDFEQYMMPAPELDPNMMFMPDFGMIPPDVDLQSMQQYISHPFDILNMFQMSNYDEDTKNTLGQVQMSMPNDSQQMPVSSMAPFPHPRKIGTISTEERRVKVQRFLEKRKRRNYRKKISYECRKRVADNRVRVKGRFITKAEAEALKQQEQKKDEENQDQNEQPQAKDEDDVTDEKQAE